MQIFKIIAVTIGMAILTSCINVDYVGQTYTREDPTAMIQWYNNAESVPPDVYQVVGRATVEVSADYDQEQVRESILAEAEKRGVDAVQVVSAQAVEVRKNTVTDPGDASFGGRTRPNRNIDQWEPYDSFGQPSSRNVRSASIMEFHAKVLFLVKKERYEKAMREFAEEQRPPVEIVPMPNSPAAKAKINNQGVAL